MGRFAKPASGGITKYYWYPGERSDWIRAAIAAGCGLAAIVLVSATTGSHLWAAVLGTSVTAGVAGVTFGRKDVRALETFAGFAAVDAGRAVWRALVKGFGAAAAAILVVHAAHGQGFVANWMLPLVPAIVGAIAHQAGMMYERASHAAAEQEPADALIGAPATSLPARLDPATSLPASLDPARLDPASLDPASLDPARLEPARRDPADVQPRNSQPGNSQPASFQPAAGHHPPPIRVSTSLGTVQPHLGGVEPHVGGAPA